MRIGVKYLKATGVTRKIDELGRIVIPKEIRRNLGIRDGESLEIFIDDEAILLKKHNQMHNFMDIGEKLINIIVSLVDVDIIITDREKVICANDKYQKFLNCSINEKLINLIDNREIYNSENMDVLYLNEQKIEGYFSMVPIISSMDSLGLVILINNQREDQKIITKLVAKILASKIDIC